MIQRHCLPTPKITDAEKNRLLEKLEAQIYDFCLDDSANSTNSTDFEGNRHMVLQNFLERNQYDIDKTMSFYEVFSK